MTAEDKKHKKHPEPTLADKSIGLGSDIQKGVSMPISGIAGAQKMDLAKIEPVLKQRLGAEKAEEVMEQLKKAKDMVNGVAKEDPTLLKALGKNLSRAGLVVTIAEGVNEVSKETGTKHKAQRAAAVFAQDAVSVTPGILASEGVVAAGSIAETGGLIIVPAAAGAMVKLDADTMIDTNRMYEKVDGSMKPTADHRNLVTQEGELAGKLRGMGVTYDGKGNVDLSVGTNRAKLQTALNEKREQLEGQMQASDGFALREAPLWRGDQLTNYNEARLERDSVNAALADLQQVRDQAGAKRQKQYVAADDPVSHGLPAQAAQGKQTGATKTAKG